MKIGTIIIMNPGRISDDFARLAGMGLTICQISGARPEMFTDENAEKINKASSECGVSVVSLGCTWEQPKMWDLVYGPHTIGLVPPAYRLEGIKALKMGSDFARKINVSHIICHAGFIPSDPFNPDYIGTVGALKNVAQYFRKNGSVFLFETGQETPVTLLRTIEDIGADNVRINLDPANLIMYGNGNPIDALDVIGRYVEQVHGKDGVYPVTGGSLGEETPLGKGKVNYPLFIEKLKAAGFDGNIIIEREISGEQQRIDILAAKELLESLI
ncbi:MAG: sugar phosphate isomerase/epimerase [Eubacteriales bacterium]|nr:sugar phosphate isomerase/epimerase [Eubacteriales bacterium]